jgi:hypothetical protein
MAQELLPVIKAFAEGKEIEYNQGSGWLFAPEPKWQRDCEYRIKTGPKMVPFTIEDNEWFRGKWVKKIGEDKLYMITDYCKDGISCLGANYNDLLEYYVFDDGEPCGKEATNED